MSEVDENHGNEQPMTTRRDALKMSGAVAAGAAALFAGIGADALPAGATTGTAGTTWNAKQLATFAGLVGKMWANPSILHSYQANPTKFLASHGLTLAPGTPAPVIPKKPAGTWGKTSTAAKAFLAEESANWSVTYNNKVTTLAIDKGAGCFSSASCPLCTFACFGTCQQSA
jgi:hypothetical protein